MYSQSHVVVVEDKTLDPCFGIVKYGYEKNFIRVQNPLDWCCERLN